MGKEILKANKEKIKAGLEKLIAEGPRWAGLGICGNLVFAEDKPEFGSDELLLLFKGWPGHSGETFYPIEGYLNYECNRDSLWKGEGLRKRQSLIRHMLMKLEEI